MTTRTIKSTLSRQEYGRWGKLIVALMSSDLMLMSQITQQLSEQFGKIDHMSAVFPFHYTDYYTAEMGANLQKQFLSFDDMVAIESLPDIKHWTITIEQQYRLEGKRRINIDPGYVTHAQMVLATTKPYSHRIYLGKGIYAELTYLCKGKIFYPLAWTYPDYREKFSLDFFLQVRKKYLQQMRIRRIQEGAGGKKVEIGRSGDEELKNEGMGSK